jgi:hypothetical protein
MRDHVSVHPGNAWPAERLADAANPKGFLMRNFILGAATFVLAAAAFPLTASAEIEYPYCASGRGTGGCSFATLDQCRATVSGAGGYCYSNPRYTLNENAFARTQRARR